MTVAQPLAPGPDAPPELGAAGAPLRKAQSRLLPGFRAVTGEPPLAQELRPAPLRWPGMLLLGAASRDAGKTTFACAVLRRLSAAGAIAAAKVTVIRQGEGCARGGAGCGVCKSLGSAPFLLTEEDGSNVGKDTARLLAAGARRVFWLRVAERHLAQGRDALRERVGAGEPLVCESNTLRRVVEPDLFAILRRGGGAGCKSSCLAVLPDADHVLDSGDGQCVPHLDDLRLEAGRWSLRRCATAIVLAGGRSTRMGRDKAMLELGGRPLIEHIVRQLEPHFREILVSARSPGDYAFLGHRVIPDAGTGEGPLRGVASALAQASHELAFIVPCDLAEVPVDLVLRLFRSLGDAEAVYPVDPAGRAEPLFALLRRQSAPALEQALRHGERRILRVYEGMRARQVLLERGLRLTNLNTARDYEEAVGRLGAPPVSAEAR